MTLPLFPEGAATPASNGRTPEQDKFIKARTTTPAHHNAPPFTSDVAARMIAGHAAAQRAAVLRVIVEAGALGATDAEIEAATGIRAQSVSPRRGELVKLGLVEDSGTRRPTPRGRPAAVWIARTLAEPVVDGAP